MDFAQIKACSKEAFKDIVKIAAWKMLRNVQKTHSKANSVEYPELTMQKYLSSEGSFMTNNEKIFAFTTRTHMQELKGNFKIGKRNILCSLGCQNVEDQKHLYDCPELEDDTSEEVLSYYEIYGSDLRKIRRV